jgi:small conductance mechanosensitive channel
MAKPAVALPGDISEQELTTRTTQRAEAIGSLLRSVVTITIWVIAALTVLPLLGINIAPLVASAGIVGIALGFGAQSLVKDYIAGILLILEDQYGIGDEVEVDDVTGTVEYVSLRYTRLRDAEGVIWYLRNGDIQTVGNKSQGSAGAS